ncbi:DUF554 family protein [Infirmifilum lucidum]|uniref:DUF554 family protein n=1 Tax=Infirmifilum lucidum TaxID=2776706 RepID=A0A7L9FFS8_9CREN|nr:DUF554 family protein [Infirmifilum lucidum]QOJ78668.1 DUF554 family protein [Infirmifilum lucidum]
MRHTEEEKSMLGTLVNTVAVLVGSTLGVLAGKRIPSRVVSFLPEVIGLFTVSPGISMASCWWLGCLLLPLTRGRGS